MLWLVFRVRDIEVKQLCDGIAERHVTRMNESNLEAGDLMAASASDGSGKCSPCLAWTEHSRPCIYIYIYTIFHIPYIMPFGMLGLFVLWDIAFMFIIYEGRIFHIIETSNTHTNFYLSIFVN